MLKDRFFRSVREIERCDREIDRPRPEPLVFLLWLHNSKLVQLRHRIVKEVKDINAMNFV